LDEWPNAALADGIVKLLRGGSDSRMIKAGLEGGLITPGDLEDMVEAWEEWVERADASLAMLHGEILIQK
jgi:hypothetical protein